MKNDLSLPTFPRSTTVKAVYVVVESLIVWLFPRMKDIVSSQSLQLDGFYLYQKVVLCLE